MMRSALGRFDLKVLSATTFWFLLVSGCATKMEQASTTYRGLLRPPDSIVVSTFAFSPAQVSPDSAIGARLYELAEGPPLSAQQQALGNTIANELANEIVTGLRGLGLPARRRPADSQTAAPSSGSTVEIDGQFLTIDEGNRLRRIVIGLGLGASHVNTQVQIYDVTAAGRVLVQQFTTDSRSFIKPGAAEGAAVGPIGAGVGVAVGVGTEFEETASADARRTAALIVRHLATLAYAYGWITREMAAQARVPVQGN